MTREELSMHPNSTAEELLPQLLRPNSNATKEAVLASIMSIQYWRGFHAGRTWFGDPADALPKIARRLEDMEAKCSVVDEESGYVYAIRELRGFIQSLEQQNQPIT